jgi:azurin
MKNPLNIAAILVTVMMLSSCGGEKTVNDESSAADTSAYAPSTTTKPYDANNIDSNAPVMEISLEALGNSMDVMSYSLNEIHVKSGSTVKIHFKNTATDKAMKHNFVVVKNGTAESVAMEGNTAGPDKNFIPDDRTNILFGSKLLEPGQSEDLTFAAPPSGTYQFVCTYPGHWQRMNGKFIVE